MRAAIAAALVLVAGCATQPSVTDGLGMAARTARLTAIDNWEMNGRLAVDTGERAFQARFRWFQAADSLTLTVRGPLGAGSFEVAGNEDRLTVLTRGELSVLTDPEIELSAMFGWWLPVTSLPYWLLGLPDDRFDGAIDIDTAGTPARFEQRLWRVRYAEFQLADNVLIPRRVSMRHAPLQLELTIDNWAPVAASATLN